MASGSNKDKDPDKRKRHLTRREISELDQQELEQLDQGTPVYRKYRALFKGNKKERYRHVRVVFIGRQGAGKTTLCHRIKQESVRLELRQPTVGADLHLSVFFIDMNSKIWDLNRDPSPRKVIEKRMGVLMKNLQEEPDHQIEYSREDDPGSPLLTEEDTDETFIESSHVEAAAVAAGSDQAFLSMWDMGGHTSFQASHNVFISSHGVYLIVFRLTDFLNDKLETDRLKKAIRLIGTFSSDELNAPRQKHHAPPLIFVGTFLDELKNKETDYKKRIEDIKLNISRFPEVSAHKFVEFCTADNSLGNDDAEVENLRAIITKAAVDQDQWDRQLPAKWLKLEIDLHKARDKGRRILTLEEVIKMNKKSIAPFTDEKELKDALEFLHCTRCVIYFREFDHVIVDPQWLADFFSILITDDQFLQRNDLRLVRDMKLYTTKGELTENLIDGLLGLEKNIEFLPHKSILLALMEKFGLIVKILMSETTAENEQFSKTYTIPSKLMELQNTDGITEYISNLQKRNLAVSKTLCFVFKDVYVPDELFHRIFAHIIRSYRAVPLSTDSVDEAAGRDQACLYLGFGGFEVDDLCRMIVSMHAERSTIAVTLISETESNLPPGSGQRIRLSIERNILETLRMSNQQHFQYTYQLHCNFLLSPYDTPVQLYGVIHSERGVRCKGDNCMGLHRLSKIDTTFWSITEDSAVIHAIGNIAVGVERNIYNRRPTPRELSRLSRLINSSHLERLFVELGLSSIEIEDTKYEGRNMPGTTVITKLFLKWTIAYPNHTIEDIQQAMDSVKMATDRINEVLGADEEPEEIKGLIHTDIWERVPSEDELQKIVENIGKMFFNLFLELGLSPPTIEQCELCHPGDFKTRMLALLRCWIDKFKMEATIGRLLVAMRVCHMDWHTTLQIWSFGNQ